MAATSFAEAPPTEKCKICKGMRPRYETDSTCSICFEKNKCECGKQKVFGGQKCKDCLEICVCGNRKHYYDVKCIVCRTMCHCGRPKKFEWDKHCSDCKKYICSECGMRKKPEYATCYACAPRYKCNLCGKLGMGRFRYCKECKLSIVESLRVCDPTKWVKVTYTISEL